MPCVVARARDVRAFYARCLVCGRTGPERPTSRAALRALVSSDAGGGEREGNRGGSSSNGAVSPATRALKLPARDPAERVRRKIA